MKTKKSNNHFVLLVEDHKDLEADTITSVLLEYGYNLEDIHLSENTEDAELFLKKTTPELIILDLQLPKSKGDVKLLQNGLSLLRYLRNKKKESNIIVFSRFPELWVIYQVISQGVSFIAKEDYNKDFFTSTIKQVKLGHLIISANVAPLLDKMFSAALRIGLDSDDTKILKLILSEKSDKEIADKLGYSEEWVASRLRKMFKYYGFKKRRDLAAWYRDYISPIYTETIDYQHS